MKQTKTFKNCYESLGIDNICPLLVVNLQRYFKKKEVK